MLSPDPFRQAVIDALPPIDVFRDNSIARCFIRITNNVLSAQLAAEARMMEIEEVKPDHVVINGNVS